MLVFLGSTSPLLLYAHTPVQTVRAPSLPEIVLPVMLTFMAVDQMFMAASGDGMAVPFCHLMSAPANSSTCRPAAGSGPL